MKFHDYLAMPIEGDAMLAGRLRALPIFGREADVGDWLRIKTGLREDIIAEIVGVHVPGCLIPNVRLLSLGLVGFDPLLQIVLPRPTISMKNSRSIGWRRGPDPRTGAQRVTPFSRKSQKHLVDIDMVKRHGMVSIAQSGVKAAANGLPFGSDDEVHIECRHCIDTDIMLVRALKVGTLPAGSKKEKRGTKRDVHGIVELVADALQGVWWEDDRQIEHAAQMRIRR